MRSFSQIILLWVASLALVTEAPSGAHSRPWRGGWYGGWRLGFYGGSWGLPNAFPAWGWGGYYPYGDPNYLDDAYYSAYRFEDDSTPSVSGPTSFLYRYRSSASPALSPEKTAVGTALTAIGIPNDNGLVHWPLGLEILSGPDKRGREADELRGQLQALLEVVAVQAANGSPDGKLLEQIAGAADRFSTLLTRDEQERGGLPKAVFEEAQRFLSQLKHAAAALRADLKPQAATAHGPGG